MPKTWPSPLQDYQGPRDPLPTEINPDTRSLKNIPGYRSPVWDQAPKSFYPNKPNFDFHSGHRRGSPSHPTYLSTHSLLQPKRRGRNSVRTRAPRGNPKGIPRGISALPSISKDIPSHCDPQLTIFRFWEKPIGPHPVAMFEVDTFTPHQTGTLFTWLAVNRGPLS